jgi:hypothetical protein
MLEQVIGVLGTNPSIVNASKPSSTSVVSSVIGVGLYYHRCSQQALNMGPSVQSLAWASRPV